MLSVVCFKWAKPGYRSAFGPEHVNTLRRMVERHYPEPHRFICVTDDPVGLDSAVEVIPLWSDASGILNPTWPAGPSCFRRLKVFSQWFADQVSDRFVVIDLDVVITGDLRPLWNRQEDFLIWRPNHPGIAVCASMIMVKSGTNRHVWDTFDIGMSPKLATRAGFKGSDQAWLGYCFGRDTPGWGSKDGVYGYKDDICKKAKKRINPSVHLSARLLAQKRAKEGVTVPYGSLPEDARIVIFTGKPDPWDQEAIEVSPWLLEHYK